MEADLVALVRRVTGAGPHHAREIHTFDHSSVVRVTTDDARSLIVKRGPREGDAFLCVREVRFYRHIAGQLDPGICPACYLAEEDEEKAMLVLQDLREGHAPAGEYRRRSESEMMIAALADLHGSARRIADLPTVFRGAFGESPYNTVAGRFAAFEPILESFLGAWDNKLTVQARAVLEELRGLGSLLDGEGDTTIVHGDAHFGNALYGEERAVLIDWGNVALGFGEIDVAHLIAMNLPREQSRAWEGDLLTIYRDQLAAQGFECTLEAIRRRYSIGSRYAVASAIGMWHFGLPHAVWWSLFTNAIDTVTELGSI